MEELQLSAVRVRRQDGILILAVVGELDLLTAGVLDREFATLAALGHSRIVLNVEGLTFCDARGLRVLIRAGNRATAMQGWLRLVGAVAQLLRVLEITCTARVLPAFASLDDALEPDAASAVVGGSSGSIAAAANVLPETV